MLFAGGFLLGQAEAAGNRAAQAAAGAGSGGPVRVLTVPGAVTSGGEGTPASAGKDSAVPKDGWNLILVNGDHPLPQDFQVPEFTQLINGHAIDKRAYPALQRMMDDCRAEGLEPTICSSYRSWEKQEELFQRKVQSCLPQAGSLEEAEEQAAVWVARPGTSEHQAGLAVDIVDKSYQLLDEGQEKTAVQQWLMEHCAEYGFILRYPTEKSALTGVGYEPWHYRYVGEEAAGEIMRQGLCLEEYLGEC
ncbi:MAG: M15 family metallopeptidase [Oscillibacter sp.]|nr:M15 family metallopeptidase [Oscillibacter sp.]